MWTVAMILLQSPRKLQARRWELCANLRVVLSPLLQVSCSVSHEP